MLHPSEHGWVHEMQEYNTDGLEFALLAVGACFLVLLIIKNWRDHDHE